MSNLYIYGAGGTGREVYDIACRKNSQNKFFKSIQYIDDHRSGEYIDGVRVCVLGDAVSDLLDSCFLVAVGEPSIRKRLFALAKKSGLRSCRLIESCGENSNTALYGDGVVIYPNSIVSNGVEIGNNVMIQFNSVVGHDIKISDHTVISSGVVIGGGVSIGSETFVGMGACIKEGLTIGSNSIIGMGSVVYNDVPNGVIVLGNPARVSRINEANKVFK